MNIFRFAEVDAIVWIQTVTFFGIHWHHCLWNLFFLTSTEGAWCMCVLCWGWRKVYSLHYCSVSSHLHSWEVLVIVVLYLMCRILPLPINVDLLSVKYWGWLLHDVFWKFTLFNLMELTFMCSWLVHEDIWWLISINSSRKEEKKQALIFVSYCKILVIDAVRSLIFWKGSWKEFVYYLAVLLTNYNEKKIYCLICRKLLDLYDAL